MSMFNFLRGSPKPESSNSIAVPEMAQPASDPEPPVSSFSFLSEAPIATAEEGGSSGFSFLLSSDPSADLHSEPAGSSFSFLNNVAPSSIQSTEPIPESKAPKDFMSQEVEHHDVKLSRVASSKTVKKKRKTARVGLGRDDGPDVGDEASVASGSHNDQIEQQRYSIAIDNSTNTPHETTVPITTYSYQTDVAVDNPPPTTIVEEPMSEALPPAPPAYRPAPPPEPAVINNEPEPMAFEEPVTTVATEASSFTFLSTPGASLASRMNQEPPLQMKSTGMNSTPQQPSTIMPQSIMQPAPVQPRNEVVEASPVPQFTIPVAIEQQMAQEANKLNASLQTFITLYDSAYNMFIDSMQSIIDTSQSCGDIQNGILHLEQKQNICAEQEDFDAAAIIAAEIEGLQEELATKQASKTDALQFLKEIKAAYEARRPGSVLALTSDLSAIQEFLSQAQTIKESVNQKLEEYLHDENDRLEVESTRISMERNHCDREQSTLSAESTVIEEAIKNQVGDFLSKKEDFELQVFAVQEEIRKLEEQLALKRQEESDLSRNLKQIESKIGEVRKKYDRQLSRIQERMEALQKAQHECANEEQIISEQRRKLETLSNASLSSVQSLASAALAREKELALAQLLVEDFQQAQEADELAFSLDFSWYTTESDEIYNYFVGDHLSSASKELSNEVDRLESSVRREDQAINDKKATSEMFSAKVKAMSETIERLEAEKKGHATSKRFKEAAAAAKEIKELSESKDNADSSIKAIDLEIISLEEAKQITLKQLETVRGKLREEQKVEKLIHYNIIKRRMQSIQRTMKRARKIIGTKDGIESDFISSIHRVYQEEYQRLKTVRSILVAQCDITEAEEPSQDDDEDDSKDEVNNIELANGVEQASIIEDDVVPEVEAVEEDVANIESELPDPITVETPVEEVIAPTKEELEARIQSLEAEMQIAAEAEEFETAAALMEQITELQATLEKLV